MDTPFQHTLCNCLADRPLLSFGRARGTGRVPRPPSLATAGMGPGHEGGGDRGKGDGKYLLRAKEDVES